MQASAQRLEDVNHNPDVECRLPYVQIDCRSTGRQHAGTRNRSADGIAMISLDLDTSLLLLFLSIQEALCTAAFGFP